jgi:RNA-dependent RNA polymerase
MGCIDETGCLAPDEVFIQCTRQSTDSLISPELRTNSTNPNWFCVVDTRVVVAKNPCMHPGDARVLRAVYRPELAHMLDCVVFPSCGKRPITNMCSGSDLDGDLYFVTWEPTLLPKRVETPMNYISPPAKLIDRDVTMPDVIQFFVDFIENDQLGRIANAHVAIADSSASGVKDPDCIKLAELFSEAVDFPKTGVVAQLDPAMVKDLKYPDFMEKRFDAYESKKVIGVMYRQCKSMLMGGSESDPFYLNDTLELNKSFLYPGYEEFLPEAEEAYLKYRGEIERIMSRFGCRFESELLVGIYMASSHNEEARDFHKLSSVMLKKLWKHMRTQHFFKVIYI